MPRATNKRKQIAEKGAGATYPAKSAKSWFRSTLARMDNARQQKRVQVLGTIIASLAILAGGVWRLRTCWRTATPPSLTASGQGVIISDTHDSSVSVVQGPTPEQIEAITDPHVRALQAKDQEIAELKTLCHELQLEVYVKSESLAFALGYSASIEIVVRDPRAQQLARALRVKLAAVHEAYPDDTLTPEQRDQVYTAEALVALTEGRLEDALSLTGDEQIAAAHENVELARDKEITLIWVRGSALLGLHRWSEALPYFERIIELDPHRIGAVSNIALCLSGLDRDQDSLHYYDQLVQAQELSLKQGNVEIEANLANDLNNRAGVLADLLMSA